MRGLKAQLVVLMMFMSSFVALIGVLTPAGALEIDTFAGDVTERTVMFGSGGGTNDSIQVLIPASSKVESATLNISGVPATVGGTDFPEEIKLDHGANGNNDWMWSGTNIGTLGHQSLFTDGTVRANMMFDDAGTNLTASVMVPSNATVTDASLEVWGGTVEGFSEIEYHGVNYDWMGWMVSGVGDLNGDGLPDFIATAPHRWISWSNAHVYVFFGNETPKSEPDLDIIYHENGDDWFGYQCAGAGDVNNDGFDDIIIGAYWYDGVSYSSNGAAFIYFGGDPMDATFDLQLEGWANGDYFGTDVAGIGDVDGDGFDDVLVGAPYNDSTDYSAGSAYLFFGGDPMDTLPDINFTGFSSYDYFGSMVADAGDFDNDGYPDFMIGARGDDTTGNNDGAVYVYRGGPGLDNVSDVNIRPLGTDYFGDYGEGVGDLNGDGFDDIAICNNYNEIWVFYGSSDYNSDRDLRLNGENGYDRFGVGIDGGGDLNNDGYDELLVGAWGWDLGKAYGKAYVFKGGANMDTTADFTFTGDAVTYEMGISIAGVGDFNNDGFDDIVIGADGTNTSGTRTGSAFLEMYYKGTRDPYVGLEDTGAEIWSHTDFFSGKNTTADVSGPINTAVSTVGVTETDGYGNTFTELTINVTTNGKGDILLKNLSIEYDLSVTVPDFAAELNFFMDQNNPAVDGFYHIPIRVMSNTEGGVKLDGLQIIINEAPSGVPPTGLSHPEGTIDESFLDLYTVFSDDHNDPENLTYNLKSFTNLSYVDVSVLGNRYLKLDAVSNTTDVNWTGGTQVVLTAVDTDGLKSADMTIDIEISNVPDAPFISSKPPTAAMEGKLYEYQVLATDGDVNDVLEYSVVSGPTEFKIDPLTGMVKWTPTVDDIGGHDVTIMVSDGTLSTNQTFTVVVSIRVTQGNTLPIVNSQPITQGTVGVQYIYTVEAYDDDWDPLSFTMEKGPDDMTINKTTGKIVWLPMDDDVGPHDISINVSDGKDRVFQKYVLGITDLNKNHMPVIVGTPPATGYVDIEYYFKFNATDEDGDTTTFSLVKGPYGMGLDGQGTLTWEPLPRDVGTHTFTVKLSDGKGFITKAFTVDISINHAPVVTSNPLLDAKVGEEYRYKIQAEDQDAGDQVKIELVRWPYGMTLDNVTNELVWTPTSTTVGDNEVSIKVSDGKHSTTQDFTVTVKDDKKTPDGREDELGMLPWLLMIVIIIIVAVLAVWALTRKKPEGEIILEDVFLIYKDGRLVSHHTRRLKPETDEYSLTAMLTAIQEFVKESIPTEGEKQKAIDQISFGEDRILLAHGKHLYIAAVLKGAAGEEFRGRMQDKINDIEREFDKKFTEWDGDLRGMDAVKLKMKELLHEGVEEGEDLKDMDEVEGSDDTEGSSEEEKED